MGIGQRRTMPDSGATREGLRSRPVPQLLRGPTLTHARQGAFPSRVWRNWRGRQGAC